MRKGVQGMKFRDLIKRADNSVEKSFEDLEADLADAVDECLGLDDLSASAIDHGAGEPPMPDNNSEQDDSAQTEDNAGTDDAATPEPVRRLTSHTQSRMAALSSFDGLFRDAKLHFEEITRNCPRSQAHIN